MSPAKDPNAKLIAKIDELKSAVEYYQNYVEATNTLLGRIAFPTDEPLGKIITDHKPEPDSYVKAYNLCDGNHTQSTIASECKIDQGQFSRVTSNWADIGIIYEIEKPKGKFYKNLRKIEYAKEPKKPKKSTTGQVTPPSTPLVEASGAPKEAEHK
ncbi:MAG: hypothetical protein ABSA11_00820 [Candidatus Bathyarchaeia archaeon]